MFFLWHLIAYRCHILTKNLTFVPKKNQEHQYRLTSNREAGYGRFDICLTPKNPADRGIIIEIKAPESDTNQTIQDALAAAVR